MPLNSVFPPGRTEKNTVKVNGRPLDVPAVPNTWLTIDREWGADDLVEIEYPFRLWFKAVDEQHPDLVALNYGPVVMVSTEMTILVGDKAHPEEWILPVEGEEMTFKTLPGHTGILDFVCRTFKPYYTYPENTWYFMYHRIYKDDKEKKVMNRTINA